MKSSPISRSGTAKPQLAHLEAASAEWIFHRDKSPLKAAQEGYSAVVLLQAQPASETTIAPLAFRKTAINAYSWHIPEMPDSLGGTGG
jgi:hypothetical protein